MIDFIDIIYCYQLLNTNVHKEFYNYMQYPLLMCIHLILHTIYNLLCIVVYCTSFNFHTFLIRQYMYWLSNRWYWIHSLGNSFVRYLNELVQDAFAENTYNFNVRQLGKYNLIMILHTKYSMELWYLENSHILHVAEVISDRHIVHNILHIVKNCT